MSIEELMSMTPSELEHHGVKGMKWGVRNDKGHEGEKATTKKIAKLDKKFEKTATKKYYDVANATSKEMNEKIIPAINSKPKYKNTDFGDPKNSKIYDQYNKEFANEVHRAINRHSESMIGKNASGTKKVMFAWDPTKQTFPTYGVFDADTPMEDLYQAESPNVFLDVTFDSKKHVIKVVIPEAVFESVIEHVGVKGMKWGVRKKRTGGNQISKRNQKTVNRYLKVSRNINKMAPNFTNKVRKKLNPNAIDVPVPAKKPKKKITKAKLKTAEKKINSFLKTYADVSINMAVMDDAIAEVNKSRK